MLVRISPLSSAPLDLGILESGVHPAPDFVLSTWRVHHSRVLCRPC